MSNNDALNYTMMYYDTFITILIALLGFSTVLVYFYIRGITRKEAEQEVSKAVNEFFFEKKESGKVLKSAAEEWLRDYYPEQNIMQENISAMQKKVNNLQEQVELIRSSQPVSEGIPPAPLTPPAPPEEER